MNFWKIICELFGKHWKSCDAYWDTVTVCKESGQLARPECPEKEERRLKKRDIPKKTCSVHLPPPPPPKPTWKICRETGLQATPWCPEVETVYEEPALACRVHRPYKHAGVPWMTIFSIYPHCKIDESDDELEEFSTRIGEAGVDIVRWFSGWRKDDQHVETFLRSSEDESKYDVYRPNPEFVRLTRRLQKKLAMAGIGILWDFFPSQLCRPGYEFAYWHLDRNINNIDTVYDQRDHAIAYFKWWMKFVLQECIGVKGNLVKFGNEMQAPGDNGDWVNNNSDVNTLKAWAAKWGGELGYYLKNVLGVEMPLSCSQENYGGTGQKLSNHFIDVEEWPLDDILCHIHIGTYPAFEAWWRPGGERRYSVRKRYCFSDDGIGFAGLNSVPEDQKGGCCEGVDWYGTYLPPRCSGNVAFRTNLIRQLIPIFEDRIRMIEWMPQRLHDPVHRLNDIDQEIDVNIYWKLALAIWGVDIRRSF